MLVAALVVVGLALALGACGAGGAKEEAKARPLPLYPTEHALRPGEYHSVRFKPPLSFKLGKGWSNNEEQFSDFIQVGQQGDIGTLQFANVKEVYKPGTTNVEEAPQDLVGWLQHHPYLKTSKPQPVTVLGDVKGDTVVVWYAGPPDTFDKFAPKAQKVVDSVKWGGS
jgi:hypothetical protein